MIIQTGELRDQERRYRGREPAAILEVETDPLMRARGAIGYALTARRLNAELLVKGTLTAPMAFKCARCGEWFRQTLRVTDFVRSVALAAENEAIDLTADIREDILLNLPRHQVCSDKCRGLCPKCGENLNKKQCACRPESSAEAWRALERLQLH
jgi:uncharacterized metal-binding protein YceD (DUF177 family)